VVDDSERYYLGKTLLNKDIVDQIQEIIINILTSFNEDGVHCSSCPNDSADNTQERYECCGINADRLDDRHYNNFIEFIDPEEQNEDNFKEIDANKSWLWEDSYQLVNTKYIKNNPDDDYYDAGYNLVDAQYIEDNPDDEYYIKISGFKNKIDPYTNQDKIRNSLQQGKVRTSSGKLLLNDVLFDLDTSDIFLYLDINNQEIIDLSSTFFNNDLTLTNIINTILNNLWEIRDESLHIRYDDSLYQDEKIGICLDMWNPYNNNIKTSSTELPPVTNEHNGLMTPINLQDLLQSMEDIIELRNKKVDKEAGKGLSQNDFTNYYLNLLNMLYTDYQQRDLQIRFFLITHEDYDNDEEMIIPWDQLTEEQQANIEPNTDYDPREDPYNVYFFINNYPAGYMPPTFDSTSPIEFGVDEHNGEQWLYFKNKNSEDRYYILKISELITTEHLEGILNKDLIIQILKTIATTEIDGKGLPFISITKEALINSAIQGATLNGIPVVKNTNNILQFNDIVTDAILNNTLTNTGVGDILNNTITTTRIRDSAVTNAKLADGAVCGNKVGDKCITNAKIADNAGIPLSKLSGITPAAIGAIPTTNAANKLVWKNIRHQLKWADTLNAWKCVGQLTINNCTLGGSGINATMTGSPGSVSIDMWFYGFCYSNTAGVTNNGSFGRRREDGPSAGGTVLAVSGASLDISHYPSKATTWWRQLRPYLDRAEFEVRVQWSNLTAVEACQIMTGTNNYISWDRVSPVTIWANINAFVINY